MERLAAGEHDRARRGVERLGLRAEPDLDVVALVPGLGLDRQLVVVHLAAQEVLRQRRALVGDAQLRGEDRHGAVAAGLAVAARGGQSLPVHRRRSRAACVEPVESVIGGPPRVGRRAEALVRVVRGPRRR